MEIEAYALGKDAYLLSLPHRAKFHEGDARTYMSEAAAKLCRGMTPVLGKWQFEANEPIGDTFPSGEVPSYRFVQEVSCVAMPEVGSSLPSPTMISPEEKQRVSDEIKKMSEEYFRLLAAQRFDDAYSYISDESFVEDKAAWIRDKRAFQALAGEAESISVVTVTVYDNPSEAPRPGLYVAADFQNAYENVPYECGYLMWYRLPDGTHQVLRTQGGHLTTEDLNQIPEIQLAALLRRLRCVAQ